MDKPNDLNILKSKELNQIFDLANEYEFAISSLRGISERKIEYLNNSIKDFDNQDFNLLTILSQVGNKWGFDIFDEEYRPRLIGINKYIRVQACLQKVAFENILSWLNNEGIKFCAVTAKQDADETSSNQNLMLNSPKYILLDGCRPNKVTQLLKKNNDLTVKSINRIDQFYFVECAYKKTSLQLILTDNIHNKKFTDYILNCSDKINNCIESNNLLMICSLQHHYFYLAKYFRANWAIWWLCNFCTEIDSLNIKSLIDMSQLANVHNVLLLMINYLYEIEAVDKEILTICCENINKKEFDSWANKYLNNIQKFNNVNFSKATEMIKWKLAQIKVFGLDIPKMTKNISYKILKS